MPYFVKEEQRVEDYLLSSFLGYSLAPNIVDPILTMVLSISICKNHFSEKTDNKSVNSCY